MSSPKEIVEIRELDPEIIPPLTSRMNDPAYEGGSKIVVIGKPGCFAPGTKVMMYDGTSRCVEDVKVGDQVMGDDSTPRNVLGLCHNSDMMYKICPRIGQSYTVNAQHKLVIVDEFNAEKEIVEITVDEFLKRDDQEVWSILGTSVEFPKKPLEYDPYYFGIWLGHANIEIGEDGFVNEVKNTSKYIPMHYKVNSKYNRNLLLSGLVNSASRYVHNRRKADDGTDKLCGSYGIQHDSEVLIDDIIFVARSLGYLAGKYKDDKRGYIAMIYIDLDVYNNPFGDSKPEHPVLHKVNEDITSQKFSIQPQGEGEYYGFTLDGNHRFLLESCDIVRNTGKSTLIKGLLYAKKHVFPVGMVMSGTEDSNHSFAKIMPNTFIYNEYNEEKIKDFVKRQKLARQHLPNPWAFIIIDDCTDDPRIFNKPLQNALFRRSRHWKSFYLLSMHYSMDMKPGIRTHIDGVFILREPLENNREKLYRNFASIIPTYNLFCDLMDQLTEDFHAIYIHNTTTSNRWQDCVFYWRAPLTPDGWKVGCPEYYEYHNARYNPEYVDSIEF